MNQFFSPLRTLYNFEVTRLPRSAKSQRPSEASTRHASLTELVTRMLLKLFYLWVFIINWTINYLIGNFEGSNNGWSLFTGFTILIGNSTWTAFIQGLSSFYPRKQNWIKKVWFIIKTLNNYLDLSGLSHFQPLVIFRNL